MTSPLDYSVYRQWIFQNHPYELRTSNLQSLHTMTVERTFYGYKPNLLMIRISLMRHVDNWWFRSRHLVQYWRICHQLRECPRLLSVVPRLGFNWKPTSTLTVKGGVYFTLCSRAVMLGGRLDASFKKGKIKASFVAGMDALVQFDPFHYEFDIYINLSVRVGRQRPELEQICTLKGRECMVSHNWKFSL